MSDSSDDPNMLAAEYVLRTLDPATAREVARRAETDPVMQAAIASWEARLAPLATVAEPAVPPEALWQRLSASLDGDTGRVAAGVMTRAWRNVVVWRAASGVGMALAAGLALMLWLRPLPADRPVAALVPAGGQAAAYVAQLQPDGQLRVTALHAVAVAAGKDLELWALPAGEKRPIPLGVLSKSGGRTVPVRFATDGTQLLISLEPKGGSPTGLPTGPVVFAGALRGV